jgi:SulP family sulfate permease
LIALGAANFFGSFFQGYPVTGGFSRTAVNASAGAKTNVAALITSALVALSLLFLTPFFYYLPNTVLAAIIVVAVFGLIDLSEVRRLERIKKADLALLIGTFLATLILGIINGIALGVGASLAWFVYKTTRPHIAVLGRVPGTTHFRNIYRNKGLTTYRGVIAVRMDAQFYFGNVAFLKSTLTRLEAEMEEDLRAVVLDASAINNLDSSGESALRDMADAYEARGVDLYLTGVKGPVRDVLESSGFAESLGSRCRHLTVHDAISTCRPEPEKEGSRSSESSLEMGVRAANASARL